VLGELVLSDRERQVLGAWVRGHSTPQALAQRAQIVLACAEVELVRVTLETKPKHAAHWTTRDAPQVEDLRARSAAAVAELNNKARITSVTPGRIRAALDEGAIAIVAGFQGVSEHTKDITTLGRGGSDTTAVALAAALGAESCEIYTDVDGVFSADPRLVPKARKLDRVQYEEMLELCARRSKTCAGAASGGCGLAAGVKGTCGAP
jgi:aspartate kinase